jgi:ubiquinone/menaquinone biosynthesis C-methylase UbiE
VRDDSARKIAEKIFQFVALKNKRVLEVGCGDGRITSLLTEGARNLVAIDPDPAQIEQARNTVSGADFRIGSGERLDVADRSFDVVVFTLSLHHQNSTAALAEAIRVIKPDGRILIVEPVAEGELERTFALVHDENPAKAAAQKAIAHCSASVERAETFEATWVFDDKMDVSRSIFEHYDLPFSAETAERIFELLGAKAEDRPIVLTDTMVIQSLKRRI